MRKTTRSFVPTTLEDARLKKRNVLVIAGEYFFPGLEQEWHHRHECIRITCSQDEAAVRRGIRVIAEEIRKL